jgi:Flp pilus assembly protein TadG
MTTQTGGQGRAVIERGGLAVPRAMLPPWVATGDPAEGGFRNWARGWIGPASGRDLARRLGMDRAGHVAIISALSMTMLCGVVGFGVDLGLWYKMNRSMQNAADAVAIAAARDGTSNYVSTGKAVAATYGYVDGTGGVSVTVANNVTCPSGQANCYKAVVSETTPPQFFSAVLGLSPPALAGNAVVSPNAGGQIHQYCLLALASSGTSPAVTANGVPFADMTGCSIMSNTSMTCHGHNLNATYGDAAGTDSGCANTETSNVPVVTDPYAYLAADIPANTCAGSYPQEPTVPATNQWTGSKVLPATTIVCGDLKLTGNTTLTTASPGSLIVIENGQLDSNGYTLSTASGSGVTIIFSGTAGSYTHAPTGSGTFNIQAPTSGTWSGVAIYQDPALTTGVNISAAGSSSTWDITGLVYLPHSSVTFSGAVNKSSNGNACFVLVVDNITINGTGSIEATGGCAAAGLAMPNQTFGGAPGLVQ